MKRMGIWLVRTLLMGAFIVLTVYIFDWEFIRQQGTVLLAHPGWLGWMTGMYLGAFALRAWAWHVYLQRRVSFADCMHGLFYSLFVNHVLPVKAGDAVRIGYIASRQAVTWDEAAHSVIVLRLFDMLVLGCIGAVGIFALGLTLSTVVFWLALLGSMIAASITYMWLRSKPTVFWRKHVDLLRNGFAGRGGLVIAGTTLLSWILEAWVVVGVVRALDLQLAFVSGVWVNSITIAGQVFHFTPGGVGTYESVMSFSLAAFGFGFEDAYLVAILSHGFKFVFSYAVGSYILFRAPLSFDEMRNWIRKKGINRNGKE